MGKDAKFMQAAIDDALKGIRKGNGPFGAAITKNWKLVAVAHNTVMQDHDPTCHAEMNAIRKACRKLGTNNLDGCVIYSTAEPCPMCFAAIHWARISKVVYGCTAEDAAKIGFDDVRFYDIMRGKSKDTVANQRAYRGACIKLFEAWVKKPTHELY